MVELCHKAQLVEHLFDLGRSWFDAGVRPGAGLESRHGPCGYDAGGPGPDGRLRLAHVALAGRGSPPGGQGTCVGRRHRS